MRLLEKQTPEIRRPNSIIFIFINIQQQKTKNNKELIFAYAHPEEDCHSDEIRCSDARNGQCRLKEKEEIFSRLKCTHQRTKIDKKRDVELSEEIFDRRQQAFLEESYALL